MIWLCLRMQISEKSIILSNPYQILYLTQLSNLLSLIWCHRCEKRSD